MESYATILEEMLMRLEERNRDPLKINIKSKTDKPKMPPERLIPILTNLLEKSSGSKFSTYTTMLVNEIYKTYDEIQELKYNFFFDRRHVIVEYSIARQIFNLAIIRSIFKELLETTNGIKKNEDAVDITGDVLLANITSIYFFSDNMDYIYKCCKEYGGSDHSESFYESYESTLKTIKDMSKDLKK